MQEKTQNKLTTLSEEDRAFEDLIVEAVVLGAVLEDFEMFHKPM